MQRVSFLQAVALILTVALVAVTRAAEAADFDFDAVSYVGAAGDSVEEVAIQSDGTIVAAANITDGPFVSDDRVRGLRAGDGVVVRLSADGRKLLSVSRVGRRVHDLAIDADDRIYVAAGKGGVVALDSEASAIRWRQTSGGPISRIDAAADGTCAALRYSRQDDTATGTGRITVFSVAGEQLHQFTGHRHTLDVAIHAKSRTVVHIGWRQANAYDGNKTNPVQIAYVQGRGYDGDVKYTLYDWSTDRNGPRFLNRPTNNMADTRGYRCAIGRDGLLYGAFECAGGNHIFRYEPVLSDGQWQRAGQKRPSGDKYHEFYNSRAEHKAFFGRYRPGTGEYLRGQQFCGRLSSGRANAVRVKNGAIAADASGRVALGGTAAYGLPVSMKPPGTSDYTGGSYGLLMRPGFQQRHLCTRIQPGGATQALAVRRVNGRLVMVIGGVNSKKPGESFWTKAAIQQTGEARCGFIAVLSSETAANP